MKTSIVDTDMGKPELAEWEQPYRSALSFLLQASMVAGRHGFVLAADAILKAVEAMRPLHPSPKLARGLIFIYQDKFAEAANWLRSDLLKTDPENDMARAFLAIALHMDGQMDECRSILLELFRTGTNEQALGVAKAVAVEIGLAPQ